MNKKICVAFISKKLKKEFESLKSGKFENKNLHGFINNAIDGLKKDPFCGVKIKKILWPKIYVQKSQKKSLVS